MGRVPFVASICCIWCDYLVSIDIGMCYNFGYFVFIFCFDSFVANYDLYWKFTWIV